MNMQYVLHPGFVTIKSSGNNIYIKADDLARLYGVNRRDCITCDYSIKPKGDKRAQQGYIHLYPDYHGDYDLVTLLRDATRLPTPS